MLYAATLTDDAAAQLKAYQAAATKYNSVRGYNNAGVVYARAGKVSQAKALFEKAAGMYEQRCRYHQQPGRRSPDER